jgi:hypothetical protein
MPQAMPMPARGGRHAARCHAVMAHAVLRSSIKRE